MRKETFVPTTRGRNQEAQYAVFTRVDHLNQEMTPCREKALQLAGSLYGSYAEETGSPGKYVTAVADAEVRKVASALIREANGTPPQEVELYCPDYRELAANYLKAKQNGNKSR